MPHLRFEGFPGGEFLIQGFKDGPDGRGARDDDGDVLLDTRGWDSMHVSEKNVMGLTWRADYCLRWHLAHSVSRDYLQAQFLEAEVPTGDVTSNGQIARQNGSCDGQGAAAVMCFSRSYPSIRNVKRVVETYTTPHDIRITRMTLLEDGIWSFRMNETGKSASAKSLKALTAKSFSLKW